MILIPCEARFTGKYMRDLLSERLPPALFSRLFLELEDGCRAAALKAHTIVRDHAGLDKKRSRELEGQARFRMMEQAFEATCAVHGATALEGGLLPGTELKIFQPFMRFEPGFILGLAAMPEPGALPHKNKSRVAAATLNYYLSPRLDFDRAGPKIGDIFVLFLVCRDREKAGNIEELAIGVVSSDFKGFLLYAPVETYFAADADSRTEIVETGAELSTSDEKDARRGAVRVKKDIKPFVPPEMPERKDESKQGE